MSEVIDAAFDVAERGDYLDEVREHLPAFLSEVAFGRNEPLDDVSALLNLRAQDLRRVVITHLAFDDRVVAFIESLPEALRQPISSSLRPPVVSQAVRGPVDWQATFRTRYQQGGNPGIFVVRPAERIFETPENQALVWFLTELGRQIESIRPVERDSDGAMSQPSWFAQVLDQGRILADAHRHRWLSAVSSKRPTAQTMYRLRAARTRFYAELLPDAIETFLRFTEKPSPDDITDLLCRRYFEPRLNWQLFELVIALRLAREFEQRLGAKRSPRRLLVGHVRVPFARYELQGGDTVRLWYQAWPDIDTRSLVREARERHNLSAGSTRPDFVIERRSNEAVIDVVLVEVKASRNPRTLGAGLVQILGYLKERPELWPKETPGWLVAPNSPAFESAVADDQPLWMVNADAFAKAAVDRFVS